MSKIDASAFRDWNQGETMNQSDYEQERELIRTAINDNYDRLIKTYQVLNTDGTVKTTQNLTTAINFIKFKESASIEMSLDTATSILTLTVKDGGITTAKLATDAVTNDKIAGKTIDGVTKIADYSISTLNIGTGVVTNPKLSVNSVDVANIKDDAVTTSKILNGNVTEVKLDSALQNKINNKTDVGHTHADATPSVAGFMGVTDKTKLDGIAANANNYAHPTGDGNSHVPSTGTTNDKKVLKAGATANSAAWGSVDWTELTGKPATFPPDTHTHSNVVAGGASGFMTGADKTKLDGMTPNTDDVADTIVKRDAQGGVEAFRYKTSNSAILIGIDAPSFQTYSGGVWWDEGDLWYDGNTDGIVVTAKLANSAVTDVKLASNAVTETKIIDGAVTTNKLGANAVTSAKLADGAVSTTAKLADGIVTDLKLASNSVTTAKITDANVTDAKLASNAVTNAKILNGAVTPAKMDMATNPAFHVSVGTNQSLPAKTQGADFTYTLINYDTEAVDRTGSYDTTNKKFTAPSAGLYAISANLQFSGSTNDKAHNVKLQIRVNGVIREEQTSSCYEYYEYGISISTMLNLALNDYVEIYGATTSASTVLATKSSFKGYKLL